MTAEELKKKFAEKWADGKYRRDTDAPLVHLLSDLSVLIEKVIEERMPTDEEIERKFPSGGLIEVTEDGKFNRPATMAMYDNLNRQQGARWVCVIMKGEEK